MNLIEAASNLEEFGVNSLRNRIASLEAAFKGRSKAECGAESLSQGLVLNLLESAVILKRAAGQVNILIHALGILLSLPYILEDGEVIQSLSLGAGSAGRAFDLETDCRVSEFKFIRWRGRDSARQDALFKDFFYLTESNTAKQRNLYLLEVERPQRFLEGGRSLTSVLSRDDKLRGDFRTLYGDRFTRVRDYYKYRQGRVLLIDLRPLVPYAELFAEHVADERRAG